MKKKVKIIDITGIREYQILWSEY